MSPSSPKDFTVAIVGGGIVGLVTAIGLARAGLDVDVFEAASKYGEIGAGIGIGANALRVLKEIGILDEVLARSESIKTTQSNIEFVRGDGEHKTVYEYPNQDDLQGLGFHRAAFLEILAGLLPENVHSHFKKRCTAVTETPEGRARLQFSDETVHEADLIIGADGIKSVIRSQVCGEEGDRLVDTGTKAYRALVPKPRLQAAGVKEELLKPIPRCYMGQEKHALTLWIMGGALVNLVAFTTDFDHAMVPAGPQSSWASWVEPATKDDVLEHFQDFGPGVRSILETAEGVNKWSIHGLYPPLKTHVASIQNGAGEEAKKCNVVLVGDAAHAMLPHLGAGAGTGIEGAYVLKSLLMHPQTNRTNLSDVLRAYTEVRVPRAHFVATRSKLTGDIYEGHGPTGSSDDARRKELDMQWEGIWRYDSQAEVARAVKILEEKGVFQHQ